MIPALLLAAASSIFGCGGDFDPGSRITGLRVLAVQADKPFAHPGEQVNLKALWFVPQVKVADGKFEDTFTQWLWITCLNPESSTVLGCFQKLAKDIQSGVTKPTDLVPFDRRDTFTVNVPNDALSSLPAEARRNSIVGVVTIVCPGKILPVTNYDPASRTLPLRCNDGTRDLATEEYVAGIKRIFIREKDRNENPVPTRVTFDGAEWKADEIKEVGVCDTDGNRYDKCDGADKHTVAIELTPGSFESGNDEFGVAFTEQVITQYYATEGLFEHDVRVAKDPATKYVARKAAAGQTLKMWLVARDNRGGVVWEQRQVKVKPL